MNYILIFIGGGVGSALRYGASRASLELIGPNFPAGTLFVNVVGSTLMGILAAWFALRGEADQTARLFLTTGIIGGLQLSPRLAWTPPCCGSEARKRRPSDMSSQPSSCRSAACSPGWRRRAHCSSESAE